MAARFNWGSNIKERIIAANANRLGINHAHKGIGLGIFSLLYSFLCLTLSAPFG